MRLLVTLLHFLSPSLTSFKPKIVKIQDVQGRTSISAVSVENQMQLQNQVSQKKRYSVSLKRGVDDHLKEITCSAIMWHTFIMYCHFLVVITIFTKLCIIMLLSLVNMSNSVNEKQRSSTISLTNFLRNTLHESFEVVFIKSSDG